MNLCNFDLDMQGGLVLSPLAITRFLSIAILNWRIYIKDRHFWSAFPFLNLLTIISDLLLSHSQWDFYSGEDPTHGSVNYQTKENAIKKNLAFVQADGTTVLAVDDFSTVPVNGRRDSYV